MPVALRKESVDRNIIVSSLIYQQAKSLSARRAWIEIGKLPVWLLFKMAVALRKESVDRNKKMFDQIMQGDPSLSARRAWIEMDARWIASLTVESLSARRAWIEIHGRQFRQQSAVLSLSARRAWIEIRYEPGLDY